MATEDVVADEAEVVTEEEVEGVVAPEVAEPKSLLRLTDMPEYLLPRERNTFWSPRI